MNRWKKRYWGDKPGKPRRVIPVRFGVFWPKRAGKTLKRTGGFLAEKDWENPETDWDDKPGKPRRVIRVHFGFFGPKKAGKTPKRTGMTPQGSPGVSSVGLAEL